MGLRDWFHRKKADETPQEAPEAVRERREPQRRGAEHELIRQCETAIEAAREMENAKLEYQVVTASLTDIQKIDSLPPGQRQEINTLAGHVVELKREMGALKEGKERLSDAQFDRIRKYEQEIPDAIGRIKNNETYQSTVKRDMQYLEGEKGELSYRITEIEQEQGKLKKLSMAAMALFALGLVILFVLQEKYRMDMRAGFLAILLLSAGAGAFIVLRLQGNSQEVLRARAGVNRAITLLNRVKIRYVNETNAVEYAYEKYGVHSAYELGYLWEQYQEARREREQFYRATDDLEYYEKKLVQELAKYDIEDAMIWIHQTVALIDDREMVEIRHGLNTRRQKLRSRIEYNAKVIREFQEEVEVFVKENPGNSGELREILRAIGNL